MNIPSHHFITKKDLADFFQKLAMLIEAGYNSCSAVELLAYKSEDKAKQDRSAEGIRALANILLPDLKEGFTLHQAMAGNKRHFAIYANQVDVGESSGRTHEVLERISEQIKSANKTMAKLRSAMTYPVLTLAFTFIAAYYLFTQIVPQMLAMLIDVGVTEVPPITTFVMSMGEWMKNNGLLLGALIMAGVGFIVFYGKTAGRDAMSRMATRLPLLGKVVQNNAMATFFKSWQQMILAGAEMSLALTSAAESVQNLYIRRLMIEAKDDYSKNGVQVWEALRPAFCTREMEVQTIQVAMEGDKLAKILGVLAEDREYEANKAVNAISTAINPILLLIVGLIVGVLVFAIYEPIISVSSIITST